MTATCSGQWKICADIEPHFFWIGLFTKALERLKSERYLACSTSIVATNFSCDLSPPFNDPRYHRGGKKNPRKGRAKADWLPRLTSNLKDCPKGFFHQQFRSLSLLLLWLLLLLLEVEPQTLIYSPGKITLTLSGSCRSPRPEWVHPTLVTDF